MFDFGVFCFFYIHNLYFILFFFFQAEDGIRDKLVTGVQTCALPISGGREALQALEKAARAGRPYPLVLLDSNMPEMDGFSVAEGIRKHPRLAGASIMMLSSSARPGDRARCEELGVSTYLTKPLKQSDILDAIMHVMSARPSASRSSPRARATPTARPL